MVTITSFLQVSFRLPAVAVSLALSSLRIDQDQLWLIFLPWSSLRLATFSSSPCFSSPSALPKRAQPLWYSLRGAQKEQAKNLGHGQEERDTAKRSVTRCDDAAVAGAADEDDGGKGGRRGEGAKGPRAREGLTAKAVVCGVVLGRGQPWAQALGRG